MEGRTPSEPRVDAVIVTYNNRDTIRECVAPLLLAPRTTVTVVDNASRDASLEAVADLELRAVQSGRNAGFGFSCNLGAAGGVAPLILLINPDAVLRSNAVDHMVRALDSEPDVVLVGPRILDEDGSLMPSMRRYQRAVSTWAQAFYLHRLLPRARWASEIDRRPEVYHRPAYPEWVSGACMLIRRDAFEAVGGFDDRFFLYCEDQDLCRRLRADGGRVRYEPSAVVAHRGGHSAPRSSLYAVLARSRVDYARKHGGRVSGKLQHAGVVAESLTHALVGLAGRPASARGHRAAFRAGLRRTAA